MKNFLKGIRGKQILVSVLSVMVIATGYYRWMSDNRVTPVVNDVLPVEEQTDEEKTASTEDLDYFARTRYERDCARSEEMELLSVSTLSEEDTAVIDEKMKFYGKNIDDEAIIETQVKESGFDDCVAFVDDEGVKVIVKADALDSASVSEIKNIIVEQTGESPTKIRISNKQ